MTRLNAGQTVRVNDYELSNLILRIEQNKTQSLITEVMILGALRDLRDARLDATSAEYIFSDLRSKVDEIVKQQTEHLESQIERFKAEYDPKHKSDCDCYGCRRFRRCLTEERTT